MAKTATKKTEQAPVETVEEESIDWSTVVSLPVLTEAQRGKQLYATANTGRVHLTLPDEKLVPLAGGKSTIQHIPGDCLTFGDNGNFRIPITQEQADKIEAARKGELQLGNIDPREVQKLFIRDQVRVVYPAKPHAPIPNWNLLKPSIVVETAANAGHLESVEQVQNAAQYESENLKRVRVMNDLQRRYEDLSGKRDEVAAYDAGELEL